MVKGSQSSRMEKTVERIMYHPENKENLFGATGRRMEKSVEICYLVCV